MVISIASGKGGTGKTTVATSLALSIPGSQLYDCDVEEPNVHVFMQPHIEKTVPVNLSVPEVDARLCTACGLCKSTCMYKAIAIMAKKVLIFSELCHGCGACSHVCPEGALKEMPREIGVVEYGSGRSHAYVSGRLHVGAAMAPPVIREVKKGIDRTAVTIIDAPPGTSCPVITAIKGTDFCVLVTEPTPFGLHDLQLSIAVIRTMGIPHGVIINRATLGNKETDAYCAQEGIPVLMRIPFDKRIAHGYAEGVPLIDSMPEMREAFGRVYAQIMDLCVRTHNTGGPL